MRCQLCGGNVKIPGLDQQDCDKCGRTHWSRLNLWDELPAGHFTRKESNEYLPMLRFGNPERRGYFAGNVVVADFKSNAVNLQSCPVYKLEDGTLTYDKMQMKPTRTKRDN
jgi:hypothetical protein